MKDTIIGTVKFIHPSGYGFVDTKDGDVFIHIEGFLKPEVEKTLEGPMLIFSKSEIDPKSIKKGVAIEMEVEEGPKGKAAKYWCFTKDYLLAEREIKTMPIYRLMSREVISGKPYGDLANRCWKFDQHLLIDWAWHGYAYQLADFQRRGGVEYQIHLKTDDEWVECQCPFGRYNGGPLFDLPVDWKRSMRCQ